MSDVLNNIVNRVNGEFYVGVVGSVRSGKSTFIKRFVENKILKYINDDITASRIKDELPQSASGKNIMTVEPKFLPSQQTTIKLNDSLNMNIRLVDCVGYIIKDCLGYESDGNPRMVSTPWFEDPIPFSDAALIGTKKVIQNHSNLGILVTTDGSVTEFDRSAYVDNERQIIEQLKELDKPFVVVLNTLYPNSEETKVLRKEIEEEQGVSVVAVNVDEMTEQDIDKILTSSLSEFEISELDIKVPSYLNVLDSSNKYKSMFDETLSSITSEYNKFKHVEEIRNSLSEFELFESVEIVDLDPSTGLVTIQVECIKSLYNDILNDILGDSINDKGQFIELLQSYKTAKMEYDKIKDAMDMVRETGYGISLPQPSEMTLEQPEIIKQSGRFGVKLKAIAPSIHMIKVDVESTFEPIIGSEEQSKTLIDSIASETVDTEIWDQEIFGRRLSDIVNDGIRSKLHLVPVNAQQKLKTTLEKIVNKGSGSLIAIII